MASGELSSSAGLEFHDLHSQPAQPDSHLHRLPLLPPNRYPRQTIQCAPLAPPLPRTTSPRPHLPSFLLQSINTGLWVLLVKLSSLGSLPAKTWRQFLPSFIHPQPQHVHTALWPQPNMFAATSIDYPSSFLIKTDIVSELRHSLNAQQ